jgi:hypothetical protein
MFVDLFRIRPPTARTSDGTVLKGTDANGNEHGIAGLSDHPHGGGAAAKLSAAEKVQLAGKP